MSKVTKVYSDNVDKEIETIEYTILCCGNIEGNNNKFYCIELQHNTSTNTYQLFTNYGRVSSSNIYEIRDNYKDEESARKDYNTIIAKKLKGKKIKKDDITIEERYTKLEVTHPKIGSSNIKNKTIANINTVSVIDRYIKDYDIDIQNLIKQFAEENIHNIKSHINIQISSNGIETALGPVTTLHIDKARTFLDIMKNNIENKNINNKVYINATNNYYSMIPRRIYNSNHYHPDNLTLEKASEYLTNEYELLDNLKSALLINTQDNNDTNSKLNFTITKSNNEQTKRITKWINDTRSHKNLNDWEVSKIYDILIQNERNKFIQKENTIELFHGTQNKNLLSILINGIIIPPYNASYCTGRMFGNGIYGADSSTKSLNYSIGNWSGNRNQYNNCFMLIVKFAYSKTYEPKGQIETLPDNYDMCFAKKEKCGLYNNEYIVYNTNQCTITNLVEFNKK